MQDVNFCLMQCLIATDGYTCRQRHVKRNNNFMDWRYFARFLLPKKRKIRMQARAKKRNGKHRRDVQIIFIKYKI